MEKVKFFRGRKGDTVGRLESNKIALINKNYRGVLPKIGETWLCRVDKEFERFAVITPIERIVKKKVTVRRITVLQCGCREIEEETVIKEVPESAPTTEEHVERSLKICEKHQKKLVYKCGHRHSVWGEIGEEVRVNMECLDCLIEQIDKFFECNKVYRDMLKKIKECEEAIKKIDEEMYELPREPIIEVPKLPPPPGVVSKTYEWGTAKCRYCKSPLQEPEKSGETVRCKCGREYRFKVTTDIEEGFWEKTWIHVYKWFIDIQKEQEVNKKINELEEEKETLKQRTRELWKKLREIQRQLALKFAESKGYKVSVQRIEGGKYRIRVNDMVFTAILDEGLVPEQEIPREVSTLIAAVESYLV
jgi:hypothetical protein